MADCVKINYKIFLEAEDVSQTRILSCASYMKNVLAKNKNPYISRAALDNESDMDDFVLRLYVDETIEEDCENPEMAENFAFDMAELLTEMAEAHSFLDMEGSFSVSYGEKSTFYEFASEAGDDGCDFKEV